MTCTNSSWLRLPSPSVSNNWKTVWTTCGFISRLVQTLTALLNSSKKIKRYSKQFLWFKSSGSNPNITSKNGFHKSELTFWYRLICIGVHSYCHGKIVQVIQEHSKFFEISEWYSLKTINIKLNLLPILLLLSQIKLILHITLHKEVQRAAYSHFI